MLIKGILTFLGSGILPLARNAQRSLRSFKEIYDLFYYIIKRERESQRDREIYVPTFFKI
jgi:hypothetical protein